MDSLEESVDGLVSAAPFLPGFDDSLIVAINLKQCGSTVKPEEGVHEEFKSDAFCPPNVPVVSVPAWS